jgi:hypothetical protein
VIAMPLLSVAHAVIFASLHAAVSRPPEAVVVFGSPRPGFQPITDLLTPVPIRAYRNGEAHGRLECDRAAARLSWTAVISAI